MEYWDIYDKNKQLTGRRMKRNDWCLKDGEYHLSVLGVVRRKDGKFLSIEDLQKRGKVGSSMIDLLRAHGALEGLSETNQLSFF